MSSRQMSSRQVMVLLLVWIAVLSVPSLACAQVAAAPVAASVNTGAEPSGNPVPEPSVLAMVGGGLLVLSVFVSLGRRRHQNEG
jgi:uncharacterized membrane protein